jgi:ribosomal protein S12 methylthiotransferase
VSGGYEPASTPEDADLLVVNTCAFIEAAREESVETILEAARSRRPGARLVVTGCLAERYGDELAAAMPEVDLVAGFGVPVTLAPSRPGWHGVAQAAGLPGAAPGAGGPGGSVASFDLVELPRPPARAPWAYLKLAEGCDRRCGFCAIPSFRGPQRSRTEASILAELDSLGEHLREVVLVAQDLASWGLDRSSARPAGRAGSSRRPLVGLIAEVSRRVERVRLLYLYPSSLDDELVAAILATGVPYFDLSLQHVSRPLMRRMRRYGDGGRFLDRIAAIRAEEPRATFRSSFIIGYPGETEEDHGRLLEFIAAAQLDWAGFFPFSEEAGTYAADLSGKVHGELAMERLRECAELQDSITAARRDAMVGEVHGVLVDRPGVGRSHREAPEIDGVVELPPTLGAGEVVDVLVTAAAGPDLVGIPVAPATAASVSGLHPGPRSRAQAVRPVEVGR